MATLTWFPNFLQRPLGLDQSMVNTGPVTVETFDAKEVAIRLGPALSYVLGIERFLLQRREIYPVFTMLEERSDSG